jgi:FkbM family methyltransferase
MSSPRKVPQVKHFLRKLIVEATVDTPLEYGLRAAYRGLSRSQNCRYDRELIEVLRRSLRKTSNCVDVGCYRGDILRQMVKFAPQGEHIAFEPVPENFQYLTRTFPSVRVLNMALSDKAGEATFNVVVGRTARSGLRKVEYPDPEQEIREVRVHVDRLDSIIPSARHIDFIKVDVEGAELRVLRGSRELIGRDRPMVVFEHGYERARYFGDRPEEVFDLLAGELGLAVSLMERWLHGAAPMVRDEFCSHVYQNQDFCFVAYPAS